MEAQKLGRSLCLVGLVIVLVGFPAWAADNPAPKAQVPKVDVGGRGAGAKPAEGQPAQPQPAPPPPAPPVPAQAVVSRPMQQDPEFGRDVTLAGMSDPSCGDVYSVVAEAAIVRLNYAKSDRDLPDKTAGMTRHVVLERKDKDGSARLLLVGLTCYPTQDARLYLWGTVTTADGIASANPDLDAMVGAVEDAVKVQNHGTRKFAVRDLLYETYQLSNIDVDSCLAILKGLGYSTVAPGDSVDLKSLPAVFPMPFAKGITVVGRTLDEKNAVLPDDTISAPENRLMIVYHPSQSVQVADLKDLLDQTIDVQAQNVLIEGMVIELNEEDLKQLGVEWQIFSKDWQLSFLNGADDVPFIISHNPAFVPPAGLADKVKSTLTAIINEGRAQVLSSPSVLVLDNRNAKIQVVQDVPVFKSVITTSTTNIDVSFQRVGIVLNIKPRISRDQATVALQILVEVSEAPQADFIVVQGQAVAPLISRRIVETIARVNDNTPFIIGGLIRNERDQARDRIPILSDIPILGGLFQRRSDSTAKREVIIVLTPRVIKNGGSNRPVLPKDSEKFDFLTNRLFRNSYRLKADDIFDVGFLENNATVLDTMDRARDFVHKHPEYADKSPFKELTSGIIPGEDAVVMRMIFEIARDKLELYRQIATDHVIIFAQDPTSQAGFSVQYLARNGKGLLEKESPDGTAEG